MEVDEEPEFKPEKMEVDEEPEVKKTKFAELGDMLEILQSQEMLI